MENNRFRNWIKISLYSFAAVLFVFYSNYLNSWLDYDLFVYRYGITLFNEYSFTMFIIFIIFVIQIVMTYFIKYKSRIEEVIINMYGGVLAIAPLFFMIERTVNFFARITIVIGVLGVFYALVNYISGLQSSNKKWMYVIITGFMLLYSYFYIHALTFDGGV